MIGRAHRFHTTGSLQAVYRRGQSIRGQSIGLKVASRDGSKPYRTAVVVSRKVHKSAVVRNRIRRRVYEVVRQYQPGVPAGTELVFTVYGEQLAMLPAEDLRHSVEELLSKALPGNKKAASRAA